MLQCKTCSSPHFLQAVKSLTHATFVSRQEVSISSFQSPLLLWLIPNTWGNGKVLMKLGC